MLIGVIKITGIKGVSYFYLFCIFFGLILNFVGCRNIEVDLASIQAYAGGGKPPQFGRQPDGGGRLHRRETDVSRIDGHLELHCTRAR